MHFNYNRLIPNSYLDNYNEYLPESRTKYTLSKEESKLPIYDLFILKFHTEDKEKSIFYKELSIAGLGSSERFRFLSDIVVVNFIANEPSKTHTITAIAGRSYNEHTSSYELTVTLFKAMHFSNDKTTIRVNGNTANSDKAYFITPHFINEKYAFFITERYLGETPFEKIDIESKGENSLRYGLFIIDLETNLPYFKSLFMLYDNGELININTLDRGLYDNFCDKTKLVYLEHKNGSVYSLSTSEIERRYLNTRMVTTLRNISVHYESGKLFVSGLIDTIVNGKSEFAGFILINRLGIIKSFDNTENIVATQNIYFDQMNSDDEIYNTYGPLFMIIPLKSFEHIEDLIVSNHLEVFKDADKDNKYLVSCTLKNTNINTAVIESKLNLFEFILYDEENLNNTLTISIPPLAKTMMQHSSFRIHKTLTVH